MENRRPLVSVVIPAYNVGDFLGATIESVLSQGVDEAEIIVVNDGSADDTANVMDRYANRIHSIHQSNRGVAAARNAGLANANGEFIAFVDGDDIWNSDNLAVKLAVLEKNPEIDGVFGDFEIFDSSETLHERGLRNLYPIFNRNNWDVSDIFDRQELVGIRPDAQLTMHSGNVFESLFHGNFILTSTLVVRRSVVEQIGYFREQLLTNEDYEFFLRLARNSTLAYVDAPLVRYRRHTNQLTNKKNNVKILRAVKQILAENQSYFEAANCDRIFDKRYAQVLTELGKAELVVGRQQVARQNFLMAIRKDGLSTSRVAGIAFSLFPDFVWRFLLERRGGLQ